MFRNERAASSFQQSPKVHGAAAPESGKDKIRVTSFFGQRLSLAIRMSARPGIFSRSTDDRQGGRKPKSF